MYADENVIKIKHAVLREVAKLAFEGTLDAQRDHIAVRLIPGPDMLIAWRQSLQAILPARKNSSVFRWNTQTSVR